LRAMPPAITLVLAGLLAGPAPVLADGSRLATPAASVPEAPVLPGASAPPPLPGLDVTQPSPTEEKTGKPIVKQWWFWTALGTAVAASVVILVLADRRPPAPNTTLGNHEFQP
jgi:hypothetical protein